MARILLLRAWDEVRKTMIYTGTNEIIRWYNTNPMRCLFIKDKNGKMIYEDDLVKVKDREIVLVEDYGFIVHPFHDGSPYDETVWPEHVEIIGNIYENPDLFEPIRLRREEFEQKQKQCALGKKENF